ncbi:MBL fold metallo-hydrolase [Paenibacillus qinlingensis]|uniref:L-ascorbate metabolism protein UlaG (Beta-lactamase superfamily) n=1 Tax=Paenibacillus qinlingensis TaxID=1837343 RepID=A0ABU1NPG1_9BACL|nr:MBL fold metallo-hydrolase [Paenibacillus qinlingensis]MDR6549371.1 L-ascorbate metabolism protein UlaG (beta-lactamase superfamily) [Paenibacillus qinlingensis]
MLLTLGIIVGLVGVYYVFMNVYPIFGRKPSRDEMKKFAKSPQYGLDKFENPVPAMMNMSFSTTLGILRDMIKGSPNRRPATSLAMDKPQFIGNGDTSVTWFGHSASLLMIDGKSLLLDPMFGRTPSPFPWLGKNRYSNGIPFEIAELPHIDAVILSHDHYDHLDYGSIMKLKDKVNRFIVPLGVSGHLIRWGVPAAKIEEHDWWEEFTYQGLELACTPANHFSGRSVNDRGATLWCSWVIKGKQSNIYFSGDSGYTPHFKHIGDKYGPFDLTLMECGQYDERWADIHLMPEETVQAHLDVKGKVMLPIHWGAFTLAMHDWNDPVTRAVRAAQEKGVEIVTPRIGQTITLRGSDIGNYTKTDWWVQA